MHGDPRQYAHPTRRARLTSMICTAGRSHQRRARAASDPQAGSHQELCSQPDVEGHAGLMSQLQASINPPRAVQESLGQSADGQNPMGQTQAMGQNLLGQNRGMGQEPARPPHSMPTGFADRRQGAGLEGGRISPREHPLYAGEQAVRGVVQLQQVVCCLPALLHCWCNSTPSRTSVVQQTLVSLVLLTLSVTSQSSGLQQTSHGSAGMTATSPACYCCTGAQAVRRGRILLPSSCPRQHAAQSAFSSAVLSQGKLDP